MALQISRKAARQPAKRVVSQKAAEKQKAEPDVNRQAPSTDPRIADAGRPTPGGVTSKRMDEAFERAEQVADRLKQDGSGRFGREGIEDPANVGNQGPGDPADGLKPGDLFGPLGRGRDDVHLRTGPGGDGLRLPKNADDLMGRLGDRGGGEASDPRGNPSKGDLPANPRRGGDARVGIDHWYGQQTWEDRMDSNGNQTVTGSEAYADPSGGILTVETSHKEGVTTQTVSFEDANGNVTIETSTTDEDGNTTTETTTKKAGDDDSTPDPEGATQIGRAWSEMTREEKDAFLEELRRNNPQGTVGNPGDPESGTGAPRGDRPVGADGKDAIDAKTDVYGQPVPDDDSDIVVQEAPDLDPQVIAPDDQLEPGGDPAGHGGDLGDPRTPTDGNRDGEGGGGEPQY